MMDNGISGMMAVVDNTAASKGLSGKNDKAENRGGFSDALSNVAGDRRDRERAAADADKAPAGQEDYAAGEDDDVKSERPAKPLIDLRPGSVLHGAADRKVHGGPENGSAAERIFGRIAKDADADEASLDEDAGKISSGLGKLPAKGDPAADEADLKLENDLPSDTVDLDSVLSLLGEGLAETAGETAASLQVSIVGATRANRGKDGRDGEMPGAKDDGIALRGKATAETGQNVEAAAADGDMGDSGQIFRFTNARGQSMDMTVGSGRTSMEAGASATRDRQIDNVTVVDARRYLGLAQNSNAANLTSAFLGDSEWVEAMRPGAALSNAAAQSSTGNVVHTLKLHMTPIDLGSVMATLRLVGDELTVHLTVHTSAAYRQLRDDASGMLDALRAQGFSVDQVSVSMASSAERPDNGQNQANNQQAQGQQQAGANENRGGGASGRDKDAHDAAIDGNNIVRNADERAPDSTAGVLADGARPDHVYI